jgi:hypothetical protein
LEIKRVREGVSMLETVQLSGFALSMGVGWGFWKRVWLHHYGFGVCTFCFRATPLNVLLLEDTPAVPVIHAKHRKWCFAPVYP